MRDWGARRRARASRPFGGLIDAVIVPSPTSFDFDGAIAAKHAEAAWVWMYRDLAPDLLGELPEDDEAARALVDGHVPVLLQRAKAAIADAADEPESLRRIKVQFGGEPAWLRLPVVLKALKCRAILEKAQVFGRAANGMTDEAALGLALQSMPLTDAAVTALLMQVAVGQVSNPSRLTSARHCASPVRPMRAPCIGPASRRSSTRCCRMPRHNCPRSTRSAPLPISTLSAARSTASTAWCGR